RAIRGVVPFRAGIRAHAGALGHRPAEILVLDHRPGAAIPLPDAYPRSAQTVEAQPDGCRVAAPLGAVHQGQGGDARSHAHPRGALVDRRRRRQEEGEAELHRPSAQPNPLSGNPPRASGLTGSRAQSGLPSRPDPEGDVRPSGLLTGRPAAATGTGLLADCLLAACLLAALGALLGLVLRDQRALARRELNGVFVIDVAAAVAEVRDGAWRLEAVAVRLVDRVAGDPELVAGHAGATAALVASHRALLLHDLIDAGALDRGQRD